MRLYDASLAPLPAGAGPPGTVLSIADDGLVVALRGGALRVGRVRASSGKEAASVWAERVGLRPGDRVESGA